MIIPEGTEIGPYKAPRNGVFMTDRIFMEMLDELLKPEEYW